MFQKKEKLSSSEQLLLTLKQARAKIETLERLKTEPIAIIGMGCRFPGNADDPQKFWQLLSNGADGITEIPAQRWNVEDYYDSDPDAPGKMNTRYGGFLEKIDRFDPQFFGISPREATAIDPQHRLLLEVSWEALENAGQIPERLTGSSTGVFVGITLNEYSRIVYSSYSDNSFGVYGLTGLPLNAASGRISYILGLTGPSVAIDTACSSSLVAIHQACQSLRFQECKMALAGGVNLILLPDSMIACSKAKMLSPDGYCRTFDIAANGIGRGEGCGVVVLKRLSDAIADRDNIIALIKGSAINQDGPSSGFTVPNSLSQQALIRQALTKAKVKPSQISYVEAHGTGTSLGDPIEVKALSTVLAKGRSPKHPLMIGSVKTNIGHLESAAGISGLIKVILQLQHKQIAPHLNLKHATECIDWNKLSMTIPTKQIPWNIEGKRRIAGVSSFGSSGTNAHVILEEAPERINNYKSQQVLREGEIFRPLHLLTLSAKTSQALSELINRYLNYLEVDEELELADICFTANTGRAHFRHRLAIIASDRQNLFTKLSQSIQCSRKKGVEGIVSGKFSSTSTSSKVAFLFTGQGSQYINMAKQLYETQPIFRRTLNKCAQILQSCLNKSIIDILYPENNQKSNNYIIDRTIYTQVILFSIEYSLFNLWQSWGIRPDVVVGHGIGEYVAAAAAKVFSLEDGLKLVANRGRLMQEISSKGEMVAVMSSEKKVAQLIAPYTKQASIAAINAPNSVVISGTAEAIKAICMRLKNNGIKIKKLKVSNAFHSPLIEPMLQKFETLASEIVYNKPHIPIISSLTGNYISEDIATPHHWTNHARQPVKFASSMKTLYRGGYEVFLEVGPEPMLLRMGKQCLSGEKGVWLPSLRSDREDWQQILESLSELYVRGIKVDWSGFDKDYLCRKVALPTYPFQRQSYWINSKKGYKQVKPFLKEDKSISAEMLTNTFMKEKEVTKEIINIICQELGFEQLSQVDVHSNLLEIGADSLSLIAIGNRLEKEYKVSIGINQFFKELTTVNALAKHVCKSISLNSEKYASKMELLEPNQEERLLPHNVKSDSSKHKVKEESIASNRIIQQQLQLMSEQLKILRGEIDHADIVSMFNNEQVSSDDLNSRISQKSNQVLDKESSEVIDAQTDSNSSKQVRSSIIGSSKTALNKQQQSYLEEFISVYTRKTQKSKRQALACRSVLADKRAAVGFRIELKEIKYPIVGESSNGSKIRDIDGNEYVDISMGFGVHLFGHQPKFVTEALQNQLTQGMQIGPQAKFAGEAARLVHEITGMERIAFCNSGTEAIMTALRLARLATGRDKIVIFKGAYHGQFDGVLAAAANKKEKLITTPLLPGVLQKMVDDTIVLTYGAVESLNIIKAHAHELAAVLVEPVQTHKLDLQPKEFLQKLRQLTNQVDIPLIFDEVVTGFRVHPKGAQGWFSIEADIATYGKCVGGGMPIGIVAGKASYMDGIDGGFWSYGDASYPDKPQTFFAGTFNKNPLSMASARAVLKQLKSQGSELQKNLNKRTLKLITALNSYFEQEYVPIKIINFGSIFRFVLLGNNSYLSQPIILDLLFYKLIEKGVYMWEGRNGPACFLSTAHTDENIDFIISAVKSSILEMRQGGFFLKNNKLHQTDFLEIERIKGVL